MREAVLLSGRALSEEDWVTQDTFIDQTVPLV